MNYSFTEKKRIRKDFGSSQAILDVPDPLKVHRAGATHQPNNLVPLLQ